MKKNLLILVSIIGIMTVFAQNRLNIHLHNSTVERKAISSIDSLFIGENDTILNIRMTDKTVKGYPLTSIDSLTFSDTVSSLPTVQTIAVDKIAQTSARSGLILVSAGASTVTARGICWSTRQNPTIDDSKYQSPLSSTPLTLYLSSLVGSTTYYVRAYATNSYGTAYGESFSFTTTAYTMPEVTTVSVTNAGGLEAACSGVVTNTGGYLKCSAQGFCWSTGTNPTLNDNVVVSTSSLVNVTYSKNIVLPTSGTTYYIRAYATNVLGTTYGSVIAVKPTMGNLTYTIDTSTLPVGTTNYNLIKIAMDSAMYYYNRYATFSGNIWVYYSSGIPTAQSNYRGSIGFGSGTTYMHVCTAMHETAHWLGSGTTTVWQNLTVNGVYTGAAATAMLKSLTGNPSAVLSGDDMHFWPYGLNYSSEVTSANDYIFHVKIVNAMKTDCGW